MTFEELWKEAAARGFSDMLETAQLPRLKRYVNEAYHEVCEEEDWPFLEKTTEGTAPLTITDLAHVLEFTDLSGDFKLDPRDRREIAAMDANIDGTGTPSYWYREGLTSFKVYPANVNVTFRVRYLRVVADLVAAGDVPLVPDRFLGAVIDHTVRRLYKNRDQYEGAALAKEEAQDGVEKMRKALMKPNRDRHRRVERTGAPGDYL